MVIVLVLAGSMALASSTRATTLIERFEAEPSTSQAGGHPDIYTGWVVPSHNQIDQPGGCDCSDAKTFIFNNPAGVVGDPHATPQCTQAEFAEAKCPVDSQVGVASVNAISEFMVPVFNLEPTPNNAGLLGFTIPVVHLPVYEIVNARTESDYGLKLSVLGAPQHYFTPTTEVFQKLWGVPASPAHDGLRFPYGQIVCFSSEPASSVIGWTELGPHCPGEFEKYEGSVHSNSPAKPFLSNPTTCDASLSSSLEVEFYSGATESKSIPWPATTGCDQLSFNPSLYAQPTTTQTDAPSGINVNLQVPQQESPTVPSPSEIKSATVTLPEGFSINAGAADGKTACGDLEARFGTEEEAHCPEFSKVGSLTIETSVLPGPLPGYVYLGAPQPGNTYRMFLVANGFGVHIKLAGVIRPDPRTGQLVISFEELPQTAFSDFNMHFFGSERGILATPTQCGTYPVESTFTPWDAELPVQSSVQYFTLNSGSGGGACPPAERPLAPTLAAGVADSTAGQHSPFTLDLTRNDGEQNLSSLSVTTPPGFAATLKGIPYCSDAALAGASTPGYSGLQEEAQSSCPSGSLVGSAIVGAGAGTHPLYTSGRVYLAGPYKGAPLSLAVITPAVSGPYDLGDAVVRAALYVNPETAQVTAVSDPLPQILEGVPLRLREIRIELDRPGFTLNPTNCGASDVTATVTGVEGAKSTTSTPFQVANCAELPFGPKLSLTLSGGVNRLGHPAIHSVFSTEAGEANPQRIVVTLPRGELLDQSHILGVCSRAQFSAKTCPTSSRLGRAEVVSPLLEAPLSGPAYLRSSDQGLPDLALELNGQLEVVTVAQISSVHEAYRVTFGAVPDVPLGTVKLDLFGGKKGLLENSEPLCGSHKHATSATVGQNGRSATQAVGLRIPCGSRSGGLRNHRRGSAHDLHKDHR
jgi:hypothetical protein